MDHQLVSRILSSGIVTETPGPRDAWSLGIIDGAPAAGLAAVILDGDAVATTMPYLVPCGDGDRVLTILLGRSRMLVADLSRPGGIGSALWGSLALAALLGVDGASSGLDADKLDGQEGSYYVNPAETTTTIGSLISGATAKTTPVDADMLGLMDSADSLLKKLSWANVKATIKAYTDTLYAPVMEVKTGTCTLNSSGLTDVSFGMTFSGTPRVTVTPNDTDAGAAPPKIRNVSATGFQGTIGGTVSGDFTCDYIAIHKA